MSEQEQWKDIPGYEGIYQFSTLKRVKRIKPASGTYTGKILKPYNNMVALRKDGRTEYVSIKTLVRKTFGAPRPVGPEGEVWKDVVGYEGLYQVSNLGRVANTKSGRILKPSSIGGYLMVTLSKHGKGKPVLVHVLVLEAFVEPRPPGHVCHHKNEDTEDNRVENLEWMTHKQHHRVIPLAFRFWRKEQR